MLLGNVGPVPTQEATGAVKPKKKGGCGCHERKEWLNKKIPGSGDLVEKVTTVTGIKGLVDFYFNETSDTNDIHRQPSEGQPQDQRAEQ